MTRSTVLLADDESTLRENLAQALTDEGFDVIACPDGTRAMTAMRATAVDAIITDLRMPGVPGMQLIDHARRHATEAVIIVITAFGEVESAVEAMKKGASEYICKPLVFDDVIFKLKRLLAGHERTRENRKGAERRRREHGFSSVVAVSPAMATIVERFRRIAHTTSNVLLLGESGTGKEVLARALHFGGITHDKPFVAVNCGALTETLIESRFFGYRRGAFTGAVSDRAGYFEAANHGTLFLDEIGNLSLPGQAVLLRAIEEKAITRVGDTRARRVNLRIVAATNQDLEGEVEKGAFRRDLYYRLDVIRATLPPLRERPEDVPALVRHFVKKHGAPRNRHRPRFTADAMEALCAYGWPGNVRELENTVERALIFAGDGVIPREDLPSAISRRSSSASSEWLDLRTASHRFERRHIMETLQRFDQDRPRAAKALGIAVSSLYRKMQTLDIPRDMKVRGTNGHDG